MNLTAGAALHQGKYLLNTRLGEGVLTLTYWAINTESGQTVVIRTFTEHLLQHLDFEKFKQQFLEIGDRLKHVKHPNLVQMLDTFEEAGCPYLVMEYVPGQTLAQVIQTEVLSEAKAIDYVRQIGNALNALHQSGLLHRDVKPQNIIRCQNSDRVVLSEFGMISEFLPGMMQTQAGLLCAGYAPLEQYSYEDPRTPATDIYGLAATLYTLLSRNPPLPAPVRQQLQADGGDRLFLQNSHHHTPKISQCIKQAIWQGLEINAQKRPQTIEAWLSLLSKLEHEMTPQPSLQECLIAQPKAIHHLSSHPDSLHQVGKTSSTNSTTFPLTTQKKPKPQTVLSQLFLTKLKTLTHFKPVTTIKLNFIKGREAQLSCMADESPLGQPDVSVGGHNPARDRQLFLRALLMTGAIAASAGLGFGIALRVNGPQGPGSTFLHTEQSFPPKTDWPVSKSRL